MPADVLREFEEQVIQSLVDRGVERQEIRLIEPPQIEFGDRSSNIAFELASRSGRSPRLVAQQIADGLDVEAWPLVERVTVAGAGFLNFYIDYEHFAPQVLAAILEAGERYGDLEEGAAGKVIVEHTSVNPNKPWHIGHARNAILGDTLGRLFRKAGYDVEIQNYVDDTGKQVAETIFAVEYLAADSPAGAKFDHHVGEQYARLHRLLEGEEDLPAVEIENIRRGIEAVMHDLEQGAHRPLVERCLDAQLETAWRLGVTYDLLVWESDIIQARLLEEAMDRIQASAYVYVARDGYQKGCLVIEMAEFLGHSGGDSEQHHTTKILIRSNGVATYAAKDIAFQLWKFGQVENDIYYRPYCSQAGGRALWTSSPSGKQKARGPVHAVVNVIGFEQQYPQAVVQAALKILGYEQEYQNSHHLAYGHVWLPEGRMSGRAGLVVSADEVIEAVVAEARKVLQAREVSEFRFTEQEMSQVSEAVGIGAVRFALLSKRPDSQVQFVIDEILNFAGYTSTYLQYAYVRTASILAAAQDAEQQPGAGCPAVGPAGLDTESERQLVFQLSGLPSVVRQAVDEKNPGPVCQYGHDLSQAFNRF